MGSKRKSADDTAATTAAGNTSKKRRRLSDDGQDGGAKPHSGSIARSSATKKEKRKRDDKKRKHDDKKSKSRKSLEIMDVPEVDLDVDRSAVEGDEDEAMDLPEADRLNREKLQKQDAEVEAAREEKRQKKKQAKKERKQSKKSAKDEISTADAQVTKPAAENDDDTPGPTDAPTAAAPDQQQQGSDGGAGAGAPKKRFIVFVGNLPYSATTADLERHFSAVKPISIRLLHHRDDHSRPRGAAFVEFSGFDYMKTCLAKFHQSTFTCQGGRDTRGGGGGGGRPAGPVERKINVELTVGGGGNKEGRKEKIRAKNERLAGQRERRAEAEAKEKLKKEKERLVKEGDRQVGADGVHPSRQTRVNRTR